MGTNPLVAQRSRSEHFLGAAHESQAASFYLQRGHQVYWPSVQQSAVDILVDTGKKFNRVQVKTATWSRAGAHKYLQCRTRLTNRWQNVKPSELYDVLFIVARDGRMWEIPARLIVSSNLGLAKTHKRWHGCKWDKYRVA